MLEVHKRKSSSWFRHIPCARVDSRGVQGLRNRNFYISQELNNPSTESQTSLRVRVLRNPGVHNDMSQNGRKDWPKHVPWERNSEIPRWDWVKVLYSSFSPLSFFLFTITHINPTRNHLEILTLILFVQNIPRAENWPSLKQPV